MSVPQHVAFVMDGNRRWARAQGQLPTKGHEEGAVRAEEACEWAIEKGIPHITLWALSTDNWKKRGSVERAMFFKLLKEIPTRLAKLKEHNVSLDFIGDLSEFPKDLQESLAHSSEVMSTPGAKHHIHIAINYGGRAELLHACNAVIAEGKDTVTEEDIASHLYTKDIPDVELIIRTGGHKRLSGFMLWQAEYAELVFSETLWPDYSIEEFNGHMEVFSGVKKNFGA